jgi:pimeloyl-ACP methyl ester carboxylesterase
MAALPPDREMIVVDRPGYAGSEPARPVADIRVQAEALAPLLDAPRGQKVMLVGQSYGAAIASLMAEAAPAKVDSLVLLSGFFGEPGPTARWLMDLGGKALGLNFIPRDLRHAVVETTGQAPQLARAKHALSKLRIPIHMVHGDKDDFAPIAVAERLASELATRLPIRFIKTAGANHFLNDGPADVLLAALESCIPARTPWIFRWPQAPKFSFPKLPNFSLPGNRVAQA